MYLQAESLALNNVKLTNPATFYTLDHYISFQRQCSPLHASSSFVFSDGRGWRGAVGWGWIVGRGHERDSGWSIAAGGFRGLPLSWGRPGQPSSVFLKTGFLCVGGGSSPSHTHTERHIHTYTPQTLPLRLPRLSRLCRTHGSSASPLRCSSPSERKNTALRPASRSCTLKTE